MARKRKMTGRDYAKAAAKARSDLNIFHAVIALMETNMLSADSRGDAERVIAVCRGASSDCLARIDSALAHIIN
jgi:hypothetical protein